MNITNCTLLDCDGAGLVFDNVDHSRVSDCLIRDDFRSDHRAASLIIKKGRGNMIVDNQFNGKVLDSEIVDPEAPNHFAGNHHP